MCGYNPDKLVKQSLYLKILFRGRKVSCLFNIQWILGNWTIWSKNPFEYGPPYAALKTIIHRLKQLNSERIDGTLDNPAS